MVRTQISLSPEEYQLAKREAERQAMTIRPVEQRDLGRATEILRRFPDQGLTLADALGLSWMGQRRPRSCWSTDRHLGLPGVRLVIHAK